MIRHTLLFACIAALTISISSLAVAGSTSQTATIEVKLLGVATRRQLAVIKTDGGTIVRSVPALRLYTIQVPESQLFREMTVYQADELVIYVHMEHHLQRAPGGWQQRF